MLTGVHSLVAFMQAGINFHLFPFLTDQGFSEINAVLVLSSINVAGAVGSVSGGLFVEKFRVQRVLCANILVSGLVFFLLYRTVGSGGANKSIMLAVFILAILQGVFHGSRMPLLNIAYPVSKPVTKIRYCLYNNGRPFIINICARRRISCSTCSCNDVQCVLWNKISLDRFIRIHC